MDDIKKEIIEEIVSVNSATEYSLITQKCIQKLNDRGYYEIANQLDKLSRFTKNRFSVEAANDNFIASKNNVINYLHSVKDETFALSEEQAIQIVQMILVNFNNSIKKLTTSNIHGKCSESLKTNLPPVHITNEYDIQHLLYPYLYSVFDDCRTERPEDTGHHSVRVDIVIDSYNIAIELKCTRHNMSERNLSEEVASDMVHYKERHIFFYIYDMANIIENKKCFVDTYEKKNIDNKDIHIIIES